MDEVGVLCVKVNLFDDLLMDFQVQYNGFLQEVDYFVGGCMWVFGSFVQFDKMLIGMCWQLLWFGEYIGELLCEFGCEVDYEGFKESGVFL